MGYSAAADKEAGNVNKGDLRKDIIGINTYLLYTNQLYFPADTEGDEEPNTEGENTRRSSSIHKGILR
jgi:hypothetical protein